MMKPHQLRDYQVRAIANVRDVDARGVRAVLLVAPTGSGKTRMGAEEVVRFVREGKRVLWLVHSQELVEQTVKALNRNGVEGVEVRSAERATRLSRLPLASRR